MDEDYVSGIDSILSGWRHVVYERSDQRDLLLEVLGFIAYSAPAPGQPQLGDEARWSVAKILVSAIGYCKQNSFAEEREVRVLVRAPSLAAVKFRSGRTGVTPYVELTGSDGRHQTTRCKAPLPIRRIEVGPYETRLDSADGTRALLLANGYQQVDVSCSGSTLR